jgi:hypothetical protein
MPSKSIGYSLVFLILSFLSLIYTYLYQPKDANNGIGLAIIFLFVAIFILAFRNRGNKMGKPKEPEESGEEVVWLDEEPKTEPEPEESPEFIDLEEKDV